MSTKIKGEAIKEGSIPLSALSTELKNKIENAGGGADWNAQKGEAGYIENKPFKVIKSNNNEITNINSYFLRTEDAYYPNSDLFIKYDNKIALLVKENRELYWGDGATLEIDSSSFFLVDDGDSNITVASEVEFELIIALNSDFTPDTVLKTTPQTLLKADKNQALANLGIADLLEALKPVQLSSEPPIGNVTQEQLDEIGLTEKVINNILNGYTNKIYIRNTLYFIASGYNDGDTSNFTLINFHFEDDASIGSFTQYRYINCNNEITVELSEI